MTLRSDYTAGTVTVAAGGTAVTGVGTAWLTAGFAEGDEFIANGWRCTIQSVDSETTLTLKTSGGIRGGALSDAAYGLRYMSSNARAAARAQQMVDLLGTSGNLEALAGLAGTNAMVPVFTGPGAMETLPYVAGFTPRGVWSSGETYGIGEVVFHGDHVYTSVVNGNVGNEPPSDDSSDANWMYLPVANGKDGVQSSDSSVTDIRAMSQEDYDELTSVDPTTFYIITD